MGRAQPRVPANRPQTPRRRGGPGSDLEEIIPVWEASLRARNRSPKTIRSYGDTARLLAGFLAVEGLPTALEAIGPEHVELFIGQPLKSWTPGTAAVRFRSLKPLFAWLVERG